VTIENPNLDNNNPNEIRSLKLRKLAIWASISVAGVLVFTKLVAYMITDSVSVMSSLMDSTFDMMASAVTMFSIIQASQPADKKHRFGHGKIESLAAIAQAIFIIVSAGYLLLEAINRFIHPQAVLDIFVGIGVMILSITLTLILISFQYYVIKETKSIAVSADNLHYKGDLLMNIGVIGSLLTTKYFGWVYFDPLFAVFIFFILVRSGFEIAKDSLDILTDTELPDKDREKIIQIVKSHIHCCGMHDLRTRYSGHQVFIEFHLELDQYMNLKRAHDVTEEIEAKLFEAFPRAEVLIHEEPCGIKDHRLDHRIES